MTQVIGEEPLHHWVRAVQLHRLLLALQGNLPEDRLGGDLGGLLCRNCASNRVENIEIHDICVGPRLDKTH
jgi:hypothetical protein